MYLNVFFIYSHLLFQTVIRQRLFQNQVKLRVLSSGWPLNGGKENRKTLIGTTISRRQLNWGGRLGNRGFICNILLTKTSGLIRAGRLIKVRLHITRRYISKSGQPLIFGEEREAMKLPRWKEMRGQTFVISIAKINRQAEAAKYWVDVSCSQVGHFTSHWCSSTETAKHRIISVLS